MHKAVEHMFCPECGGQNWVVRWQVMRDGRDCYPYVCKTCNYRSPVVEKHHMVLLALERIGMTKSDISYADEEHASGAANDQSK